MPGGSAVFRRFLGGPEEAFAAQLPGRAHAGRSCGAPVLIASAIYTAYVLKRHSEGEDDTTFPVLLVSGEWLWLQLSTLQVLLLLCCLCRAWCSNKCNLLHLENYGFLLA